MAALGNKQGCGREQTRAAEWICWAHPREAEAGKGEREQGLVQIVKGCWDFKPWKGTTLAVWRDKRGPRPASLLVEKQRGCVGLPV